VIVLVIFSNSDLKSAKTRTALVVQANDLGTGIDQIIVAMITSRMARGGHPSKVVIDLSAPLGKQSGPLRDSVVMTDNLATVFRSQLDRRIGSFPMADIQPALRHTLGL
jgi:mRNA interferase MazF